MHIFTATIDDGNAHQVMSQIGECSEMETKKNNMGMALRFKVVYKMTDVIFGCWLIQKPSQ